MQTVRVIGEKIERIIPIIIVIFFFNRAKPRQRLIRLIDYPLPEFTERHTVLLLKKVDAALIISNFLFEHIPKLNMQKVVGTPITQMLNNAVEG